MWVPHHFLRIPQIYAVTKGLTMALYKVQIIQDWPIPWKVKDIQSFLGFANFYHHFIYRYSEITVPLMRLTRKGTPGILCDDCHSAFKHLKRLSPQLWSLPIGSQTLKLQSRLTPLTMHSLLSFPLCCWWWLAPYFIHSWTFSAWNLITMSMTKSYFAIFWSFQTMATITSKALDFRSMWSQSPNLQYFSRPKSSRVDSTLVRIPFQIQSRNLFPSWKTQNQTRCTY